MIGEYDETETGIPFTFFKNKDHFHDTCCYNCGSCGHYTAKRGLYPQDREQEIRSAAADALRVGYAKPWLLFWQRSELCAESHILYVITIMVRKRKQSGVHSATVCGCASRCPYPRTSARGKSIARTDNIILLQSGREPFRPLLFRRSDKQILSRDIIILYSLRLLW